MGRNRHHHQTQATHFDQRQTRDANEYDESKRRKMIRWIKSRFGYVEAENNSRARDRSSLTKSGRSRGSGSFTVGSAAYGNPQFTPSYRTDYRTHVLIVGGGIGGLCLAQGLKKNGIPFTVFERDPSPNYRAQGYRVRINNDGYEALKTNLSPENFEVFLRATGHFQPGFKYLDAETGGTAPPNAQFSHKSSITKNVFSADRAMLRSLLLTDLNENEIQYGMAFKRFHVQPNGQVEVTFENGKIVEGSVLVGADGTTSRVRRQYVPRAATLLDTDSGAIYGKTLLTPEIESFFETDCTTMVVSKDPMMSLVMEPRCKIQADLKEFATIANSDVPDLQNYICWVLIARAQHFHRNEDTTVQDLFSMSPAQVANLSNDMTRGWCPEIRAIFEHQSPEWSSFLRISTMSPDILHWQPSTVTLIGDAVHTMAPAGIGCNTALHDAQMLVKYFREVGVGVDAIAQYEHNMRQYGSEGISISMDAGKMMYGLPEVEAMCAVVY
ncbi:Cercosporin toxin biosynthesis protein [Phytophthora megakarya]|uniref:Cercosporin toxin biosynthesis protein n=1 Tax=Phytophthora megakarya TaxID=4795 RepID=A0A225VCY9_9STRA|nr:Cercosporin toxin biosynthesis protein [Phytophthora megakarya]